MPDDRIAALLAGLLPQGPIESDAMPFPVLPGQEYAMGIKDPRKIKEGVPKLQMKTIEPLAPYGVAPSGPGPLRLPTRAPTRAPTAKQTEKAFEQMRQESAGLTREQRREQMRQEGQAEFDRVQGMSEADWAAELAKIQGMQRR